LIGLEGDPRAKVVVQLLARNVVATRLSRGNWQVKNAEVAELRIG